MTPDFEDLLTHLNAEGARYLVVGGYAVGIYAQPRATKDLDIFIGPDVANGEVVWRALAKFGAPVAGISAIELAEPYTFFTWGNPPFRVDILTHISGVTFEDAWSRRMVHTVNDATGLTAPFISAADLIINKLEIRLDSLTVARSGYAGALSPRCNASSRHRLTRLLTLLMNHAMRFLFSYQAARC